MSWRPFPEITHRVGRAAIDVSYRGPVRIDSEVICRGGEVVDHAGALAVQATRVNQDGGKLLQALIVAPRSLAPRVD